MGGVYAEFKSGIFMGCPWRKESARRWGAPQRWSLARMRSAGSRFRGSGGRMLRDGPPRMVARPIWSGRERSSHSRFPPVPRVRLVTLSFSVVRCLPCCSASGAWRHSARSLCYRMARQVNVFCCARRSGGVAVARVAGATRQSAVMRCSAQQIACCDYVTDTILQ